MSRTDGVFTVGSCGVKITFRSESRACTSCSIDDMCRVRQSEPAPAAIHIIRVVLVSRSLHQLHIDGTCSARQSEPAPAAAQMSRGVLSCSADGKYSGRQSEPAPAATQTARLVFVGQSSHQLQHRRRRTYASGNHTQVYFLEPRWFRETRTDILILWSSPSVNKHYHERPKH